MFRSAFLILSGNAAAALLLLLRNLIVARMIPVADYGVAATFALVMAVVEMVSALGLQQQIVQASEGDDPRFQAALQGFQVLRGVVAGAILFGIAGPTARFMGIPDVIWAYQILALVPVLNAAQHFDIHRLNRRMVFWPLLVSGAMPALISLVAALPLVWWLGDWRVMLYAILLQSAIGTLTSHLVAERPYRLVFDRGVMARSLRFGWPLLLNGILMFLAFQGDKLIVGRALGMEVLAIFAMGMTLTLAPTLVLAKSLSHFFLPQLARSHGQPEVFTAQALVALQAALVAALVFLAGVVLLGGPLVQAVLGEKYAPLLPFLSWFGLMQTFRVLKAGPAIVALAAGQTANPMIANLVRVLALPLCWQIATTSGDLLLLLQVATGAELCGHVVAVALLLRSGVPLRQAAFWGPCLAAVPLVLLAGLAPAMEPWLLWPGMALALLPVLLGAGPVWRHVGLRPPAPDQEEDR